MTRIPEPTDRPAGAPANPEADSRSGSMTPVVFLDRDGTLNIEKGYLRNLDDLELAEGAAEAVRLLNEAKVATVLITNQSGPARGYYPESHVQALLSRLSELLAKEGALLNALYYCPHHPQGIVEEYSFSCQCRKPATGLLEKAFAEHSLLDRNRAYMVGDQSLDIDLARNFGIKSVLLKTGYGQRVLDGEFQWKVYPSHVADNVLQAAHWILRDLGIDPDARSSGADLYSFS